MLKTRVFMNYFCLQKNVYFFKDVSLMPLRKEDIYLIKQWRNDQVNVLRQQERLTNRAQEIYYETVIIPLFSALRPSQLLFSYLSTYGSILFSIFSFVRMA